MRRLGILLMVGGIFVFTGLAETASFRPTTPKRIVAYYFKLLGEVWRDRIGRIEVYGLIPREKGSPIRDEAIGFFTTSEHVRTKLKFVWDNVIAQFEGKTFDFEEVIAEINNQMKKQGFNVDEFYTRLRNEFQREFKNMRRYRTILERILGTDFKTASSTLSSYYGVVEEEGIWRAKVIRPYTQTLGWFIEDWYITNRLMGLEFLHLQSVLTNADDFLRNNPGGIMDAIKRYLGVEEFRGSDWAQASTLLFFADQYTLLTRIEIEKTAGDLISEGYGFLVEELEALKGETLFLREPRPGGGYNILIDKRISPEDALRLLIKRMDLSLDLRGVLSDYFGRDLSLLDPVDAGIIGAAVHGVFGRIREKCYNPLTKKWSAVTEEVIKNATKEQIALYEIALEIKSDVKQGFKYYDTRTGRWILLELDIQGSRQDRVFLEDCARRVLELQKYGGFSRDTALVRFREMLDFSPGAKGDKLKNILSQMGRHLDFRSELDRSAYIGMMGLVSSVLSRPKYFGIREGDFEQAFNKTVEIFETATRKGLLEKICRTYKTDGWWDFSIGLYAGIYTFWAQVLAAKGERFVEEHLKAREKIFEALRRKIGLVPTDIEGFKVQLAFENKLGGRLEDLKDEVDRILTAIEKLSPDMKNLGEILDSLPDPSLESLNLMYPQMLEVEVKPISGYQDNIREPFAIQPYPVYTPYLGLEGLFL